MSFIDRAEAGRKLAPLLMHLKGEDVVVVGLPGGGVPVADEIARALHAPLDVVVVRKLGLPFQPEVAMGAVGEDDVLVLEPEMLQRAHVGDTELGDIIRRERLQVRQRTERFRLGHPRVPLAGRTVVVVDDGIATGSTVRAALRLVHRQHPARVVLATPVCAADTALRLRPKVDEMQCVELPEWLGAVGQFYRHFEQVSNDQVARLLQRSRSRAPAPGPATEAPVDPPVRDAEVSVEATGEPALGGHLLVPERAQGLVVFGQVSGSSRHSPRNRYVTAILNRARLATLMVDLLTPEEALRRPSVFDIELLADRFAATVSWVVDQDDCQGLPVGLFATSTGAAGALRAAVPRCTHVAAVVCLGGRPDLARPLLGLVQAPALLIVGSDDDGLRELNSRALESMRCEGRLTVVPGADRLFDELGHLEQAADLAADWFLGHLGSEAEEIGTGSADREPR